MATTTAISTQQTSQQTHAAAQAPASANVISLPAVPALEQKEDAADVPAPLQFKSEFSGGVGGIPPAGDGPTQFKTSEAGGASASAVTVDAFKPVQKQENKTGMPDNLKSGVENLSGHDMSDVKVHYNSSQPAQLNALAYAQGTDIHVAPGQEKHLPHEAWHVVQQKQGRVQPTIQMKQGVPVNDDAGLEQEADVMGMKALQSGGDTAVAVQRKETATGGTGTDPVQMKSVKIIGVKIGKTRIYNGKGTAVGHIAKNTLINIDDNDITVKGDRTLVRITSGEAGILWDKKDALLNDEGDLWISQTRYVAEGEEAADEATGITIPIFGQDVSLSMEEGKVAGELEEEVSVDLPKVALSFDFPLPAPAPVFVTVGLSVGLDLGLSIKGGYELVADKDGQRIKVEATAGGKAGMDVSVNVGAGVGVANLGGIEGGLFAGAASEFKVEGSLKGEINKLSAKEWTGSTLTMGLSSSASLVGQAGTYIKAKILHFSKEKKFALLEKEFAKWEYARSKKIEKAGVTISDIVPKVSDFRMMLNGQFAVEEDERDTAPLLGGKKTRGVSSDDYDGED